MVKDEMYVGEDVAFCQRLEEAGHDMWIDPEIELIHAGSKNYYHSYKDYLLNKLEN
jgi:hypothetical protein